MPNGKAVHKHETIGDTTPYYALSMPEEAPVGTLCKCGKPATYMMKAIVLDGSPYHEIAKQEGFDFEVLKDGRVDIQLTQCEYCPPLSLLLFHVVPDPLCFDWVPVSEDRWKYSTGNYFELGETLSRKSDLSPIEQWFVEFYRKKKKAEFAYREIIVEGDLEDFIMLIEDLGTCWFRDDSPARIGDVAPPKDAKRIQWPIAEAGDSDAISENRYGIIEVKDWPGKWLQVMFKPWSFPNRELFWQMADEVTEEMERRGLIAPQPAPSEDEATKKRGPIDIKLDTLLAGQIAIREDLSGLHQAVLARFDASEQTIIATVIERLDQGQLATVQTVLNAIEAGLVPIGELEETLVAVQHTLSEIEQQGIALPDSILTSEEFEHLSEVVDAPKLDAKHKLKVTVPIIPYLLSYEGEVELKSGLDLEGAWKRLVGRVRDT